MLCSCSDKDLRLFNIDFANLSKRDKNYGRLGKRIIYLRSEYKDVINGRKWQNSAFAKLN